MKIDYFAIYIRFHLYFPLSLPLRQLILDQFS